MNQILFYKKNRVYNRILILIILLIIVVFLLYLKEEKVILKNKDISNIIEGNYKTQELYEDKSDIYYGKIIIDKIGLDSIILNEYSEENLKKAICKLGRKK